MSDEKPFRVLLDLSELNLSVSKYVWMNVSPRELNNIADFKNAVVKKLNFDRRDIKLFVHDGLLPEDEKIIILRENDTVKLQYDDLSDNGNFNSSVCEFNTSKFSNSGRNSTDFSEGKGSSKKRKRKSDISDVAEESNGSFHKIHKKKKKHKRSSSSSASEEKSHSLNLDEQNIPGVTISECKLDNVPVISIDIGDKNGNENTNDVLTSEGELGPFNPTKDISVTSGNNCKKHKRKRHKKRRNILDAAEFQLPLDASATTQMKNTPSTFTDKFSSIRKHIRFTSPAPNFDETNSENVELVDLNSYVRKFKSKNSLDTSENDFKTPDSPVNKSIPTQKNSTPSQTYLKQNSWSVSPMRCVSSIETEQPSKVENNKTTRGKKETRLAYSDYPSLNCLPSVGAHIAFKTLELDDSYSPSVTPYKEGIIRAVDYSTEALDIDLVAVEIKPGRAGKFENLAKDEVPRDQIIKNVTLTWSTLIDPRCITEELLN